MIEWVSILGRTFIVSFDEGSNIWKKNEFPNPIWEKRRRLHFRQLSLRYAVSFVCNDDDDGDEEKQIQIERKNGGSSGDGNLIEAQKWHGGK